MKKKSVSQLKKIADKAFSIFIRKRGVDFKEYNTCYTCGLKRHWKELQCGHFISRAHSITRYDPANSRPQCPNCNIWRRGNYAEYAQRLIAEIGLKKFNALVEKGRQMHQFTVKELEEIINKYSC